MAKKGKKDKKKQKLDQGVEELLARVKDGDKSSATASAVSTWMGQEYEDEIGAIRALCRRLRDVPVPGGDAIVGGYSAESVALSLARSHSRLDLLLRSWRKEGMPAKDAPVMRMVRADMRVLAEITVTMLHQLLQLGDHPTAGGTQ